MQRTLLGGKIHRATVTHADLDYEGSLTIDQDLMAAANMVPNEQVHVWNVTRGSRIQTYALQGEAGSGVICANGAAAHLFEVGDLVIIATFVALHADEVPRHEPAVVLVDGDNHPTEQRPERPGPHS